MAELSQYQKYIKMSSSKKSRGSANWGYLSDSTIQNGLAIIYSTKKTTPCFLSNFWEVKKRLIN